MTINECTISGYIGYLAGEERSAATIEKYARDVRAFAVWLGGSDITKETAALYKQELVPVRKAAGVNAVMAALNSFFAYMGLEIKLKPLKVQARIFRQKEKELTKAEYERLVRTAQSNGNERLNLVLQTICSTGIRVSELRFITVAAAKAGEAEIRNKGKTRTVFLPKKLQTALVRYARGRSIASGSIFVTKNGKPVDRSNIWADMKKLCAAADVPKEKVFPHNLRRLFARAFYGIEKDIMRLADILGHSDVNTTRIYLQENGDTHRERINALGLVLT